MKFHLKYFFIICLTGTLSSVQFVAFAQQDTTNAKQNEKKVPVNSFFSKVVKPFKKDTVEVDASNVLKTNEAAFIPYKGKIIRNIIVERVPFGISIGDTTRRLMNSLTNMANYLHHLTKNSVVEKNLFFHKGDSLRPFLMADNESYLRRLLYIQDASIVVLPAFANADSIDVFVEVKDVFSLGGAIGSLGLEQTNVQLREDNFAGTGNAAIAYALYQNKRKNDFGLGGEYTSRNIGGSFIDGTIGYQSFYSGIQGQKEDNNYYINFTKPLVNRYMYWTYELNAAYHATRNMYSTDSVYLSDLRYRYNNLEGWVGYNINAKDFTDQEESNKLRKLIGVRYVHQRFLEVPTIYKTQYNWQYAQLSGVLATFTLYRQNFYKTKYIYGFGRNEDIPEGLLLSITSGYTQKQNLKRPFIGFNYQRYRFNTENNYLSYTIRAEGYLNQKEIQDINLLASIFYFDHLKMLGTKWKQRFFLNIDAAQQINTVLNQPLFANSQFGLPEYGNENIGNERVGGTLRTTVKAESEFFSPWSLFAFKFAPFVFSNIGVFTPYNYDPKFLSSIGGGIRTRNESLVFGTIELRWYYFPEKNFHNERVGFSISTNIIFKYNTQFVTKPDFIQIN
ncbi:MAG: hypothetical protein ABI359_09445 [Ginsengibacter sp.]